MDILKKQRDEVLGVLLTTFNKELHEKCLKEDAFEDGKVEGAREKLINLAKIKLAKGKSVEQIADELEETVETITELIKQLEEDKK